MTKQRLGCQDKTAVYADFGICDSFKDAGRGALAEGKKKLGHSTVSVVNGRISTVSMKPH